MPGELKELFEKAAEKRGAAEFHCQSGTVKSVDWANRVCVVTVDEDYDVPGVRLRAVNDGNAYGYCMKPTANSNVLIAIIYGKSLNAYVAMFSQIDGVSLVDGNGTEIFSIDIPNGNFVFNGGNNGGMVIAGNAAQHFNTVEKDLNTVKTAFAGWVVAPQDGGAALKAATAGWAATQITLTQPGDLENNKIKQ